MATVQAHGGLHGGVQDFPKVAMKMFWNPLNMILGGEATRSLDGKPIEIFTPRWSGKLYLDAYVFGGTYYHGVDNRAKLKIDYSRFNSSKTLTAYMPAGYEYMGSYLMIHEYLNNGLAWTRTTSSGTNASNYIDRYTSVGWSRAPQGGTNYPGLP